MCLPLNENIQFVSTKCGGLILRRGHYVVPKRRKPTASDAASYPRRTENSDTQLRIPVTFKGLFSSPKLSRSAAGLHLVPYTKGKQCLNWRI